MNKQFFLEVEKEDENQRFDKFLQSKINSLSYAKIQKLIRIGYFKVNQEKKKSNYKIKNSDKILCKNLIDLNTEKKDNFAIIYKKEISLLHENIIFENKDFLVLNKPEGISVQGGTKIKFNIDLVLAYLSKDTKRLKLVHRIDKNTSGLLLIAKSKIMANKLTSLFKKNKILKKYFAICIGKPADNSGMINYPLVKSKINGKEMMVLDSQKKKPAETFYKVLQTKNNLSFLQLEPKTGRTHQIRAHLKLLGYPILGDHKYTSSKEHINKKYNGFKKMHLHARFLSFYLDDKKYQFKAELPKYFIEILKENNFKVEQS